MSWTTPRTWSTGEIVTAAELNTDIRDNLTFIYRLTGTIHGTDAAILRGTGFTAARVGTGSYTITFTTPFAAAPAVIVSQANAGATFYIATAQSMLTTGFAVQTGSGSINADSDFSFIAAAV